MTRGQGAIYTRGDSLWVYLYLGGADRRVSVAKSVGKAVTQATWDDAVTVLTELREQKIVARRTGSIILTPRDEHVTVATLAKDYIATRIALGVKDPQAFRCAVERTVAIWGTRKAATFTTQLLARDIPGLLARGLMRSTIRQHFAQLHAILVAAGDRLPRVPKMPAIEVGPLRRTVWTEDELERFCAVAPPWAADLCRFGFLTGWRRHEVLDLTWDRVDLKEKLMYLDDTKTEDPRVRPIDPPFLDVTPILKRRLEARRLGCPLVFHLDGVAIRNERFYDVLRAGCSAAKIGEKKFHDFRRRVADFLLLNGVGEFTVQEYLGHRSLASTRRYARQNVQRMRSALERVETMRRAVNGGKR